ncbi:GRM8, partial [Symbiodinium pilosum]
MWCAGEIVTAYKNKVTTVPLICDGFIQLDAEALELIPDVWTAQQKQILANYGITMEDVKK